MVKVQRSVQFPKGIKIKVNSFFHLAYFLLFSSGLATSVVMAWVIPHRLMMMTMQCAHMKANSSES